MSIKERKELAKYLKHGDLSLIAEKSNMNITSVSKWVNGHIEKSGCSAYFIVLATKRKEEASESMNEV